MAIQVLKKQLFIHESSFLCGLASRKRRGFDSLACVTTYREPHKFSSVVCLNPELKRSLALLLICIKSLRMVRVKAVVFLVKLS